MRPGNLVSAFCVIACGLTAQDLSPEVLLLSHIKAYLRSEFAHLPDFTCLETIERFSKQAAHTAKFRPLDTVRLEIGYSDRHEWYGRPGDLKFTVDNPAALAGTQGLIADGMFGITLHNLFATDIAVFTSRGEDAIGSRKAAKFDFRFPAKSNVAKISILGGTGWVNEEGSVWADPQSFELLRLDGWATEIPPSLPLGEMKYSVTFARTRIGEFDALLAQDAGIRITHNDGSEAYDRIAFTHCRMFQTSSTLRFDIDPAAPEPHAPPQPTPASRPEATSLPALPAKLESNVPAKLRVTIEVTSPVSSEDRVGKVISGRVVGDVRRKGKVVLKDGTPVRGRIRRLERYEDGSHFIVGLEFMEVENQGVPLRFYADLVRLEKWESVQQALRKEALLPNSYGSSVEITLTELPGVASFFLEGKTFVLPPGLRTVWQTRGLLEGVD